MSKASNADGTGKREPGGETAGQDGSGKGKPGQFKRMPAKNQLAQATRKNNSAPDLKTAVERAEKSKAKLQTSFLEELDRLVGAIAAIEGTDGTAELDDASRHAAYQHAHELRGQGGSFGYPLATLISDSLCKVLENPAISGGKRSQLVALHVQALERVRRERLSGEGGALGKEFRQLIAQMEHYHP